MTRILLTITLLLLAPVRVPEQYFDCAVIETHRIGYSGVTIIYLLDRCVKFEGRVRVRCRDWTAEAEAMRHEQGVICYGASLGPYPVVGDTLHFGR